MTSPSAGGGRSVRYVAPFALFLVFLGLSQKVPVRPELMGPLWFVVFVPICILSWPKEISVRPLHWGTSSAVGILVFAIWIAPDLLMPSYRASVLFSNSLLGHVHSSLPDSALRSPWVLGWRAARAALIVPVVEELFWRAWMMRWLIDTNFETLAFGSYAPAAFWITAVLFASEHGPYWDVGLLAGLVYNLWMIRTKSLPDCVLMHAVTNAALSVYIIASGQWQYWQ